MRSLRRMASRVRQAFTPWFSFSASAFRDSFTLDLRSLALFRIGLGLLILVDLGIRLPDLHVHYTGQGLLPITALPSDDRLSIHLANDSAWYQGGLFCLSACFALALVIGFHTRLATMGSWFLLMSLHARNPFLQNGGDTVFRLLLFWGMFLPLGARFSLDRRFKRGRYHRQPSAFSMGTVAYLCQVCFIYWFAVMFKTAPSWRVDGTAVYLALSIDNLVTAWGRYLLRFPELLRFLTFSTYWFELIGPCLLFVPFLRGPLRTLAVLGFVFFHVVGLGLSMELILFPYTCAAAWFAVLPGWFWEKLKCLRMKGMVEWGLMNEGRIASFVPIQWCANNLRSTYRTTNRFQATVPKAAILANILAGFFLVFVTAWNIRSVMNNRARWVLPSPLNRLGTMLGLNQRWSMFAPRPTARDGWYVVRGKLRDGTELDFIKNGVQIRTSPERFLKNIDLLSWHKPELISASFSSHRWRKYMNALRQEKWSQCRPYYTKHLAHLWNSLHSGPQQLELLELYYVLEKNLPNYRATVPKPCLLHRHVCKPLAVKQPEHISPVLSGAGKYLISLPK